uniref:TnpA transposase n=1 Tax=Klebsiella pneumoniae TaxID=573 RepID=A0A8B0STH3_KLEPN|nr:TnpA transposase [Klebsiella pneumoniae]
MATVARRCEGVGAGARRSRVIFLPASGILPPDSSGFVISPFLQNTVRGKNTRREHAALIRQHYQYREFARPRTFRLTRLFIYPELDKQRTSRPAFSIWRQGGLCNIVLFSPEPLR